MAQETPAYDFNADPRSEENIRAARARGWTYEEDWNDYLDRRGKPVLRDRFRERPLDPAALK